MPFVFFRIIRHFGFDSQHQFRLRLLQRDARLQPSKREPHEVVMVMEDVAQR